MNKTLNTFPFGSISMNPYTISLLSVSLCIPTNNMLENESLLEKEKIPMCKMYAETQYIAIKTINSQHSS